MARCPRCKQQTLDVNRFEGESDIYGSRHLICESCYYEEQDEIEREETNDLPETLASYGPPNDFRDDIYLE
ncbi:hypothetical protein [Salipiger marinus]|uniref:hypothetical protein n=1 Tax=Salipiger marinus TaxID=555512 RepID=UPI004058627E